MRTNGICKAARWVAQLLAPRRGRRSPAGQGATAAATGLEHLTDQELRRAWDHTSHALANRSDASQLAALAITRHYLLDEMCVRNLGPARIVRANGVHDTAKNDDRKHNS